MIPITKIKYKLEYYFSSLLTILMRGEFAQLDQQVPCLVTGDFRTGDIKSNYADTARSENELGFRARRDFRGGIKDFTAWVKSSSATIDAYERSIEELARAKIIFTHNDRSRGNADGP